MFLDIFKHSYLFDVFCTIEFWEYHHFDPQYVLYVHIAELTLKMTLTLREPSCVCKLENLTHICITDYLNVRQSCLSLATLLKWLWSSVLTRGCLDADSAEVNPIAQCSQGIALLYFQIWNIQTYQICLQQLNILIQSALAIAPLPAQLQLQRAFKNILISSISILLSA